MAYNKELTVYYPHNHGDRKLSVVMVSNILYVMTTPPKEITKAVVTITDSGLEYNGQQLECIGLNPKTGPRCPPSLKDTSVKQYPELAGLEFKNDRLGAAFLEPPFVADKYALRKLILSKYAAK